MEPRVVRYAAPNNLHSGLWYFYQLPDRTLEMEAIIDYQKETEAY